MQLQGNRKGFDPQNVVALFLVFGRLQPVFILLLQQNRAGAALLQRFRTHGLLFQYRDHVVECGNQCIQRFKERTIRINLFDAQTHHILRKRQSHITRCTFHRRYQLGPVCTITRKRQAFCQHIAAQLQYLRSRNRITEEQTGGFRQLMRLVKDHSVG